MVSLAQCLAVIAVAVWAVLPVLIKHASFESNIALFLVIRFAVSTVLLSLVLVGAARKLSACSRVEWLGFLVLNSVIYFLQTVALQSLPATLYIVVFSLTPVLCFFTLRIRLSLGAWGCVLITAASCVWFAMAGESDTQASLSWVAVLAMLGGMLGWALYSAFIQRVQSAFSDLEIAGLSSVFGLVAALPLWAFHGFELSGITQESLLGTVLLGLIVPLGYYTYSYALRKEPVFAITSQYFEPFLALCIAVALTTETINGQQAIAAVICISAAILTDKLGKQHATG